MNQEAKDEVVYLYLDDIIPNRFQPREVFDEKALKELAVSIKEHGVIQPIIVRNVNGKYEIIAGERRYKASALAGLTRIPAIIRNLDDKESSKVALLENLQRKNLNPIEEARTYQKILEIDQMTQEELAKTMGKSQSSVANKLRLLSLPDEVQEALLKEQISERHARALLNVTDNKKQSDLLKKIINNKMTVRALEDEINKLYPKDDNESGETPGEQYVQIPTVSSTINYSPLTPTNTISTEQSNYGKVTIAPPKGEELPSVEKIDNFINYGEIDKDQLEQQNNINTRTDYYTKAAVNPVDVKSMQENAIDINSPSSEPIADLDNLLNITNSINPHNYPDLPYQSNKAPLSHPESMPPKAMEESPSQSETDYFGMSDVRNIELSHVQIDAPQNHKDSIPSASQNAVLNISESTEKRDVSQNAISKIKELISTMELQGVKVSMDEMDFGKTYQIIIKIDK